MCGIAGIVGPDPPSYRGMLRAMIESLAHRGPDDSGEVLLDGCALGHARLAVVDLLNGQQPMRSARRPLWVTFNGEIYGYQDLRRMLSAYPFRTASDTEVILALYESLGPAMLHELPGMFAFALWDGAERSLFCARDRFGEKPFYYALGPRGELVFSSEIRAIIATGIVRPQLSRQGVAHYLQHLYVHPHRTIYENVHALPPAHCLTWKDDVLTVRRYWEPPRVAQSLDIREAAGEFRRLMDRAVARQLVADVPVGAFLSGGLDSSTVVAAADRRDRTLLTFSFGFGESINELPYARLVAELYGTQHTELVSEERDIAELLITMQHVYDEPFGDSSNIPTFLLARQARRHVKVALSGDGADELLGGYAGWYRPLADMVDGGAAPAPLIPALRRIAALAKRFGIPLGAALERRVRGQVYREQFGSVYEAHRAQNCYFADEALRRLGLPRVDKAPLGPDRYPGAALGEALRMDVEDYMPGDILVKTDRATMAHGLELRAPFLDRDVAEFCLSLPDALKVHGDEDKRLLRAAFANDWPPALRTRRKQGFGGPVEIWLRQRSVRSLKERTLGDPRHAVYDLLPHQELREYVEADDYRTWTLLVLALWLDAHPCAFEGKTPGD